MLMSYFISDIKKTCKSRIVRILFLFLLAIMVFDPISVYFQGVQHPEMFDYIGKNPFPFWLLMNSVNWGNSIYNTLFFVFPVLVTGLVFYNECTSSMLSFLITRDSKKKYMISKVLSTFVFSLLFFFLLLLINLLTTYIVFDIDAKPSDYYNTIIPKAGSFAFGAFEKNPFLMALLYTTLNAVALAIFSVFSIAIHMIIELKNQYIAIAVPIVIMYVITFVFDSTISLFRYNISMILQPAAAYGLTVVISYYDVAITFLAWIFIDILLVTIGYLRRSDIL